MNQETKEIEFEVALKKLETIVEKLEGGDLSLEEALKQYGEGVRMADVCSKKLSDAEKKVEVLMKTGPGKFKAEAFEETEDRGQKSEGRKKKTEGRR